MRNLYLGTSTEEGIQFANMRRGIVMREIAIPRHAASDPYLHFDGKCQFKNFMPNFADGVTEFEVVGDVGVGYAGSFVRIYIYDSSTSQTQTNSKNFSLNIRSADALFNMNTKMYDNDSAATFNPPAAVVDRRMLHQVTRIKVGCGAKSFAAGTMACYGVYNGRIFTQGADVAIEKYGYYWNLVGGSPSIGWAAAQTTDWGVGTPSVFDLYSLSFSQNGVLTNTLVPALRSDGVACLYDEIRQTRVDWSTIYSGGQIVLHGTPKYVGI